MARILASHDGIESDRAEPRSRSSVRRTVAAAGLEDAPLLIVVFGFVGGTLVLRTLTGYPAHIAWGNWWKLFSVFALLYAFGAALVTLVHTVLAKKRSLRRLATWTEMLATLWSPQATLNFVILTTAYGLFMPVFLGYKQSISLVHPFSLDVLFMEWDRILHFGRQPYEGLQPLLGHPAVTLFIDRVYFLWIHVMWMTVIWQTWHGSRRTPTRSQFLLAFVLCWVLIGTVLAALLSSAGPIFFARVTDHPDPFVGLMTYLQSVDAMQELRVLRLREFLWDAYLSPESTSIGGISAMPSMHVAIVTLLTLLGFRVNRWLGWAYAIFAFLILIGSVHLAWHYAIDGYLAIVAAVAIWWISGRVVRWWRGIRDGRVLA